MDAIPGLHCPNCGSTRHRVTDSRPYDFSTRRRRRCLACGDLFTTFEMVDSEVPTMGKEYGIKLLHAAGLAKRLLAAVETLGGRDA